MFVPDALLSPEGFPIPSSLDPCPGSVLPKRCTLSRQFGSRCEVSRLTAFLPEFFGTVRVGKVHERASKFYVVGSDDGAGKDKSLTSNERWAIIISTTTLGSPSPPSRTGSRDCQMASGVTTVW